MKQFYEVARMDVVLFEDEDVITTSGGGMINNGAGGDVGSGDSESFENLFPGLGKN